MGRTSSGSSGSPSTHSAQRILGLNSAFSQKSKARWDIQHSVPQIMQYCRVDGTGGGSPMNSTAPSTMIVSFTEGLPHDVVAVGLLFVLRHLGLELSDPGVRTE